MRFGLDKYHGKGGPLYVGKLSANYMSDYFVNAAKEAGYQEKDQNSEQTEGKTIGLLIF